MPDNFAWLIITALSTAVMSLSGIIFKLLTDRVKELQSSNDRLRDANSTLQTQMFEQTRIVSGQNDVLNRILNIVEDIQDSGSDDSTTRTRRPGGGTRRA